MTPREFVKQYVHCDEDAESFLQIAADVGLALVPVEPTEHQKHTAYDQHMTMMPYRQSTSHDLASNIYKAMIEAAQDE